MSCRSEDSASTSTGSGSVGSSAGSSGVENLCQDDVRRRFLEKLAYSKNWVPRVHRSPQHQTVIIFDWDDTLLCTTWLNNPVYGPYKVGTDIDIDRALQQLQQLAKDLLYLAAKLGRTYIITNSSTGWVERSAAQWAPEILPALRKTTVVSARDKFGPTYPSNGEQWKIQAFLELQRKLDATPVTNIVSCGDADFEMKAAHAMGGEFQQSLIKTVKFQPQPHPLELVRQVEAVAANFERIVGCPRDLNVALGWRGQRLSEV